MVSILALRDLGDGVSLSKKPKMWQMPSSLDMDVLQEKSESLKVPRGNCFVK